MSFVASGKSSPPNPSNQAMKRQRVPVSCAVCRKRKIKCDRKKPHCTSCIKSGIQYLCLYEKPAWINAGGSSMGISKPTEPPGQGPKPTESASKRVVFKNNPSSPVSLPPVRGAEFPATIAANGSSPRFLTPSNVPILLPNPFESSRNGATASQTSINGSIDNPSPPCQDPVSTTTSSEGSNLEATKDNEKTYPNVTAPSPTSIPSENTDSNNSLVHKEIEMLKDRINRLQASVYMTQLSKPNGNNNDRQSPSPFSISPRNGLGSLNIRNQSQISPDLRSSATPTFVRNDSVQLENNQRHDDDGSKIKSSANGNEQNSYNNDLKTTNIDLDNMEMDSPSFLTGFGLTGQGNKRSANVNSNSSNVTSIATSKQASSNGGKSSEYNMSESAFFDNFMKSIQKSDFLNYINLNMDINDNGQLMYSVPASLSNKFTTEESESTLDLANNSKTVKSGSFDNLQFSFSAPQNMLFFESFNSIWLAFENDFYIKSSFQLACVDICPLLAYCNQLLSGSGRFKDPTNEELSSASLSINFPLSSLVTKNDLRIVRDCIKANIGLERHFIEPIINTPSGFSTFDPVTQEFLTLANPRYRVLERVYLKALFKKIHDYIPERKVVILLLSRFFKTICHAFPYLHKGTVLMSVQDLDEILHADLEFEEITKRFMENSVTYTLDNIGILFVILHISYTVVVDRIKEKVCESKFNENSLDSAEKYLISLDDIKFNKFIHIAKTCFSFNFKLDDIYENFHKVKFGLAKVQLGLSLLLNNLCFEDQMKNDGIFFKNVCEHSIFDSACGYSDTSCDSTPNTATTESTTESTVDSKMFDDDYYAKDFVNSINSEKAPRARNTNKAKNGNFSFKSKNFMLSVQNLLMDNANTFNKLFDFAFALKMNHDPMDFIDLNLVLGHSGDMSYNVKDTLQIIKSWRLTWLEIVHCDRIFSMILGTRTHIDDDVYDNNLKGFSLSDNLLESPEDKVVFRNISKRRKVQKYIFSPICKLYTKVNKQNFKVKLKDYLAIINSIDNFIQFHNDYRVEELFDFVDGFKRRYPIYFRNIETLNDQEKEIYYDIENKSISKSFEVINSLSYFMFSIGAQFSLYYTLFSHLDRLICFERSKNDVPVFKKIFINTETIFVQLIAILRRIFGAPHYRKFFFNHFKVLIKRSLEPFLLSMYVHQIGVIIRLYHTIRLLKDFSNEGKSQIDPLQNYKVIDDNAEKIVNWNILLNKIISSVKEIEQLLKTTNNYDNESLLQDLTPEQFELHERVNHHSLKTNSLYSSELIAIISLENAILSTMNLESNMEMFEDDIRFDSMDMCNVKLKRFATTNGKSVILPNFNSFLYFDNTEISYIANELMKDFSAEAPGVSSTT
ncbi:hypothetical protein DASC09_063140 [Saccharomycopsis crataegensis]|uniref:Zn(2)-C6 fungal-type domain-containing protein n=1 Tax=Saccharomycopsis crataegensis TaxID=43959 RepID=A0AAV5QXX8_9ASCO|nr:hypothetical protein DASC09_063140 [Saccharomycopsis crataegensis]